MSYIRCLSNPEGLYIWAGFDNMVQITLAGEEFKEKKNLPTKIFDGLIEKWNKNYWNFPCEYKGARIEEVWIPIQSKLSVIICGIWNIICSPYYSHKIGVKWSFPHTRNDFESYKIYFYRSGNFKIRLSYNNWYVDMWQVTWEHIAR